MFSRLTISLLFYFDLWGYCTECRPFRYRKYLNYIVFLFHTAFLLFALSFSIYQIIVDEEMSSRRYLAQDALKSHFVLITHWAIIIEALYSRQMQRQFWMLTQRIQLNKNEPNLKLLTFTMRYIHCLMVSILSKWLFTYVHSDLMGPLQRFIYYSIFMTHNQMYMNRTHYYTLHVEIVQMHLEHTIRIPNALGSNVEFNSKIIRCFRKRLESIGESIEHINHIFGWSNVATILFSFNLLLAIVNWTIAVVPGSSLVTAVCKMHIGS